MQRPSEQRAEMGSIAGKQSAASEADGGGQSRIDRMTRGDMQVPKFGIQGCRTIRQLQGQVPPRFLHHAGICQALVRRPIWPRRK